MTEDQPEQEALGWLADVGYSTLHGVDIASDGAPPERASYQQVLLLERLRGAIARLPPGVPEHARTLRDTLLPRLISGQLRLPEAEAMLKEA